MSDWSEWDNRVIVRGNGFFLIDSEGRRYLDGTASMWCNVWGHGRNAVVEAMRNQLKDLQHSTLFGLANKTSAILAERLVKLARGMDRVFYTDNGSTAIEASMKIALQYWRNKGRAQKKAFISLDNAYHGDTSGAMSVGYIEKFFAAYKPMISQRVFRLSSPKFYLSGYDDSSSFVQGRIEQAETLLRQHGKDCAALVMESGAQVAGGSIIYPAGYQKELARLCRSHDVLLILDEIATGFGRLGNMAEYLAQDSQPDIVCFGKALTGGYFPLAATLTTDRVFNEFLGDYSKNKHLCHGHTYTGHPVGCAAAIANIELYRKQRLLQKIRSNAAYLGSRIKEFWKSAIVADVRHKGMLAGIELARDGRPLLLLRNREKVNYFVTRESLKRGVHLRPIGNVLLLIPPLAIHREHLDAMIDTYLEILAKIERL